MQSKDCAGDEQARGVDVAEIREADRQLHEQLVSLKNRRHALEADELTYLLEAEDTRLYWRRGHVTMVEYMERELHYSAHAAYERLRVARALVELPKVREEFARGEMSFSSVRELTRIVTPETEDAWIGWARGRTAAEVQREVSGRKRGELPTSPKDPALTTVRIVLEVRESVAAQWKAFRAELDSEHDERLDDTALLETTIRRAREPVAREGEPTRPAAQVALTTCKSCKLATLRAGGFVSELLPSTAERLLCDSEYVGDLEVDAPERITSAIPESIRRKVWIRDAGGCRVPGCRAARCIDIHHIRFRSEGGGHEMWNLILLCSGHHQQLHEGRLRITGRAPDELVFEWVSDVYDVSRRRGPSGDIDEPAPSPSEEGGLGLRERHSLLSARRSRDRSPPEEEGMSEAPLREARSSCT
jgi:hypothetical protein